MMVWLDASSSEGLTPSVILVEGTVDHGFYIKYVLPVTLKHGNEIFSDEWIFQQDDPKPHRDHLTLEWLLG